MLCGAVGALLGSLAYAANGSMHPDHGGREGQGDGHHSSLQWRPDKVKDKKFGDLIVINENRC
jgi:hypothetical protein